MMEYINTLKLTINIIKIWMKRNSLFVKIVEQNSHQKKLDFTAKFVNQI